MTRAAIIVEVRHAYRDLEGSLRCIRQGRGDQCCGRIERAMRRLAPIITARPCEQSGSETGVDG